MGLNVLLLVFLRIIRSDELWKWVSSLQLSLESGEGIGHNVVLAAFYQVWSQKVVVENNEVVVLGHELPQIKVPIQKSGEFG